MGYVFDGCFARYVPGPAEAMRERWPHARVRRIERPFDGVCLRLPWVIETEEVQELVYRFRDELPEWSRSFPGVTFVQVMAECFGGSCEYEGYVCRDGRKVLEEPFHPDALGRLMAAIGVTLKDGYYFEPFTREFAWE
jgi:hypothetical protein